MEPPTSARVPRARAQRGQRDGRVRGCCMLCRWEVRGERGAAAKLVRGRRERANRRAGRPLLLLRARRPLLGAGAHLSRSISTSSPVEQHQEEVDPAGLEVLGESEAPPRQPLGLARARPRAGLRGPAHRRQVLRARATAGSCCWGQAGHGAHLTQPQWPRATTSATWESAPSSQKLIPFTHLLTRTPTARSSARARLLSTCLQKEKKARNCRGPDQPRPVELGEQQQRAALT